MKKIWLNVDDSDMAILMDALSTDGFQIYRQLQETADDEKTFANALGCTAVVSGAEEWNERLLSRMKDLALIVRYGSGVDNIDVDAATVHGIAVSAAAGMNARAVAEAALIHILNGLRHFERSLKDSHVPFDQRSFQPRSELYGKTIGLLGAGRIGAYLAEYLQPFHVKIYAFDICPDSRLEKQYNIAFLPSIEDVLQKADVVSIHLPLTGETRGIINKKTLSLMKKNALLINTSRGAVINEKDLYRALAERQIDYAGLDVVCQEPLSPENPLLSLDNISITPHIAANTKEAEMRTQKMIAQITHDFFHGRPSHIINPNYILYKDAK